MHRFDAIIFIGPQGSGKGTQASILARQIDAEYIEAGAMLRKISRQDSDFGRHINNLVSRGDLVDDSELIQIINEGMSTASKDRAVIFDGTPRKIKQAEFLIDFLRDIGRKNIATIYITLPRPLTIARLQKRLICTVCEHPEIAGSTDIAKVLESQRCSVCGGKLMHRKDDVTEAINRRLNIFETETLPVVDFLGRESKIFRIDGSGTIPVVTDQIYNSLGIENQIVEAYDHPEDHADFRGNKASS
jgi:adenylate kinase